MSLEKKYIRDGKQRIIGSVTTGFADSSSVVRDQQNRIIGRTNERFQTTRDAHGKLISTNSADPGLLIGRRKK
jgi:YD repeat-containing protein